MKQLHGSCSLKLTSPTLKLQTNPREEVALIFSGILIHPSAEAPYDDLKNAILRRVEPSKAGSVTKLLPTQPAVSQSSVPLHAQLLFRPAAVPKKNKPIFHNDQIPAYTSTGEVKFMCVPRVPGRFNGSFYGQRAAPTFVSTCGYPRLVLHIHQ